MRSSSMFVCTRVGGGDLEINAVQGHECVHVDLCAPVPVTLASES